MNKIKDALRRLTTIRALVLGIFFAALYYYFIYDNGDNLVRTIAASQKEIDATGHQVKEISDKLDRAHEYQRSAAEMGEALNRLLSYIPEDFRSQDFMKLVSEEAKIAGLNIMRINEGTSSNRDKKAEFEELMVSVELQGSFAQQMTFLANLTKRKQIFILDRFTLSRDTSVRGGEADFPVLTFRADVKAYRYVGGKPKS